MHFLSSLLVGATALVSFVAAQSNTLILTGVPNEVEAGQTYTLTYVAPEIDEPVTITLREGDSGNLNTIATLTSSATGGTYQWTVAGDLFNSADYALQITQGDQINYTGKIALSGGSGEQPESSSSDAPSSTPTPTPSSIASSTVHSSAVVTTPITTPSPTHNNSTMITSATPSPSSAGSPTNPGQTTGTGPSAPTDTGAAVNLKSPAALVLGAIVALAYLQ
ncbi:hypothetical protein EJ05DRAFT_504252 [Pseudovirgaria hyperparasitica]|uniref:Yeast cell wall synthesis Kre9/Knh1-like N-terminal domain-containing protein n=1 Tax=Pseudovirgaria hyperparasitica TaxID=470096 RepID=A0A6A6VZ99_9PEZI|nr:uncharacterized protein EJ05DRAFT_504252 [Pseudovirgaria hyperparasitica]KAF2754141.1 hypothetical protein EJ05DRAFT_504252 [Pseudovirgaria hyperparasitica]